MRSFNPKRRHPMNISNERKGHIRLMLQAVIKLLLTSILISLLLSTVVYTETPVPNRKFFFNVDDKAPPSPATAHLIRDVAINCGSVGNSTARDGREWIGESAMAGISGESISSVAVQISILRGGADSVPYKTSRISATEFRYTFRVIQGQKIIRLHFYPAFYRGFEKLIDYFSVKAGHFTLLRDYSASLAARNSGVKFIVKEFCLNVEGHQRLELTFSPSPLIDKSNGKTTYAFVNGIEIISMPTGLYYTPEQDVLGARIVGLSNRFYIIDTNTALEVKHRINIGGNPLNAMEDFGLFRRWDEDTSYLLDPRGRQLSHRALKYKNIPAFVVPLKVYQTSRKIETELYHRLYHLTWKIPIDLGFGYLVRLHFCDYRMSERGVREFSVLINNKIAETWADVIRWSGDVGIPIYKDYLAIMDYHGDEKNRNPYLMVRLESENDSIFELLKGMEIFKLSDLENNLAAPDLVDPKGLLLTSWNLKTETLSIENTIGVAVTVTAILMSTIGYGLGKCWENSNIVGEGADSASVELCPRYFSLAAIKLATQNFSDGLVIGKGGFGKVYKGVIPGDPGIVVAIKRLNMFSRQGANEFRAEIETLSKLRHIQLVSLIGYCDESTEMILVYEYIPGGTLADNLYKFARKGKDCVPLSWEQRVKICIGAARGLEYLHTSGEYGIIHRDIKDTNILLGENFVAKISDFGLSKLEKVTMSKSYVSTRVKGTLGYLDPDYVTNHRLTRKSDVYSFGVVMLVVLSGKPALDSRNCGEPESLLSCFREFMAEYGDASRIVDPCLKGDFSSEILKSFVEIVENCLQLQPNNRPTMAQVVSSLELVLKDTQNQTRSDLVDSRIQSSCLSHHEASTPEQSVISPPAEINPGKNLQRRRREWTTVLKSLFGWLWKVGNGEKNFAGAPVNLINDVPGEEEEERAAQEDRKSTSEDHEKSVSEEDEKSIAGEDKTSTAGDGKTSIADEDHQEVVEQKDVKGKKVVEDASHLKDDDEQLSKACQESFNLGSPPYPRPHDSRSLGPSNQSNPSEHRICAGCKAELGHGRYLTCMGATWHPKCFMCRACGEPISDYVFSLYDNQPHHQSCYKILYHPFCDVCKDYGYMQGIFTVDGRYLALGDGRKLCFECSVSAIMDSGECQHLYIELQNFYEGLQMKLEQQIPILLVGRQALNETREGEKQGLHNLPETTGLCFSEERDVGTILRPPRRVGSDGTIGMFTRPADILVRPCEVTAIMILSGLPRLLTGSILANVMMEAWLRLQGYSHLSPEVENGICQLLAYRWPDSQINTGSGSSNVASTSSSSSSTGSSKKEIPSQFQKKLGEYFMHRIESDTSSANIFKQAKEAVVKYGLKRTLDYTLVTGSFP
ncbi:OLC1v1025593C3 [Oldenlandia corymbosa var. corymbosa]|uniref:OLC1v1025593C3 n=1 Tax=Oldenlandia corymbosa var. corymbosa TaxID=529605 RepID=A0AAV1C808_OLDCO|nr:OLC1v1025593C3 [Oldenlandia corymbosa var. corymbosa]